DPGCAIAFWGVAMTRFHELWDHPDAEARLAGWKDVQEAKSHRAKMARERAFIDAVGIFYADPGQDDYDGRAQRYSEAMEQVHKAFPEDDEAAAFYALALL